MDTDPLRVRLKLRLYIAGHAPRSRRAVAMLGALCRGTLAGRADLEVIDVHREPHRIVDGDLVGLPTLIKLGPAPPRRILGELADPRDVLIALGIDPVPPGDRASTP